MDLDHAVPQIEQGIYPGKGNAIDSTASELQRNVGAGMVPCTAQVGCKIDRRINLDMFLSRYRRQQPGREIAGGNLHLYRPMQGIGPLGGQNGITGFQCQLMNLYGIVFILDIDMGRLDSRIIQIPLCQSACQACPGIICRPVNGQLPFQAALDGLQGSSCHFQDAGKVRRLNAGPGHNPAIRRIISAAQFIGSPILLEMKIRQPENTAVISEIALYIIKSYAIKRQRVRLKRTFKDRAVHRAANVSFDIHDARPLRSFLRHQTGNIEMAAIQCQIHLLSQGTGNADRSIIGRNIAISNINRAIVQRIIGTDIFVQIPICRTAGQMERPLRRRLVQTARYSNGVISPARQRKISPPQCRQQPFQPHMLRRNLQLYLPRIQICHAVGRMGSIDVAPDDGRNEDAPARAGNRAINRIKRHSLYTAATGLENHIPVRAGTIQVTGRRKGARHRHCQISRYHIKGQVIGSKGKIGLCSLRIIHAIDPDGTALYRCIEIRQRKQAIFIVYITFCPVRSNAIIGKAYSAGMTGSP